MAYFPFGSNISRVTELNLTPKSSCGCGGHDESLPELDVRTVPHAIRHAAVFGVVDNLQTGASFVLVAPHNPLPLLGQIQQKHGDAITFEYLEEGPEAWKLKVTRG